MYPTSTPVMPQTVRGDESGAWLRLLTPAPKVILAGPLDSGRQEKEAYIARCYEGTYGAKVKQFMPSLLSLECPDTDGSKYPPLFLEQYLDKRVEQHMTHVLQVPIARMFASEATQEFKGWPEQLLVKITGLFPSLVHRALVKNLALIKQ